MCRESFLLDVGVSDVGGRKNHSSFLRVRLFFSLSISVVVHGRARKRGN